MPPADDKLKDKVEALLEEKIPAIEVKLAEVSVKADQMLHKMDGLASTVQEHVALQTRHELRIAAIEAKTQATEVLTERKRDRRKTILVGILGAAVSATVGFFLKWFLGM